MTTQISNLNKKVEIMHVKKLGRPCVYKDREVVNISLPKKARAKADELRGKQPLATFLTELVCKNLGVEDVYVN